MAQSTVFRVVGPKRVRGEGAFKHGEAIVYQPLTKEKEIRLLILEPGQDDEGVQCQLVDVGLSWRTRYEALSYTWGDANITTPIECSGKTLNITTNLHSALRDLRYHNQKRVLWVDAVCINQKDDKEKEKQIMLMGSIYSNARQVLIYLGKLEDDVKDAMDRLKQLDSHFRGLYVQRYTSRITALGPWTAALFAMIPPGKPVSHDFDWKPVIRLLQHPWFQRTWIIQEVVLANRATVFCGKESVSWLMFERAVNGIYFGHAVKGMNMMRTARRDRYQYIGSKNRSMEEYSKLLDLLLESATFEYQNPRDKIFGLLGIAKDAVSNEYFRPNYSSRVEDVFKNFVIWDILSNKSLRSLSPTSNKSASTLSLPTWVPDFTRLDDQAPFVRWEYRMKFQASKDTRIEARLEENNNTLHLKGIVVDSIHTISNSQNQEHFQTLLHLPATREERASGAHNNARWYRVLKEKEKWVLEITHIFAAAHDRRQLSFYPPDQKPYIRRPVFVIAVHPGWEQLWRAMTCNHTGRGQKVPNFYKDWVAAYIVLVADGVKRNDKLVEEWLPSAQIAERGIRAHTYSRRFVGTERGLIGWVPRNTRKGDLVCIFYGATVPHVLRPVGKERYELVGECYIQGIMDGEAVGAEDVEEKEFALV